MSDLAEAFARLSGAQALDDRAPARQPGAAAVTREVAAAGVAFVSVGGALERRWRGALSALAACVRTDIDPDGGASQVLLEGGGYDGTWLESTATINAEVLERFAPSVTRATHLMLARHQRADGLLPYKVTSEGPAYNQIQMVTPLARCVWRHYLRTGRDRVYLATMLRAMTAHDRWLSRYRDTRGTGGVEAFCTYDTGHDASPRFAGIPDRCPGGDAARYDGGVPTLPFVAPDLTANVACQRGYLALISAELGQDPAPWHEGAEASRRALLQQCFDEEVPAFYDRTATDELLRLDSDVLLRVLACEIGDDALFARALTGQLLNPAKFRAAAGLTSIAQDDPRFDGDASRNSWAGPVNMLTMLRAPDAFERHGAVSALEEIERDLLAAMARHDRFPQCVDVRTGEPGFAEAYGPAMLWLLDAIERSSGILPLPDGRTWLSAMPPDRIDGPGAARATGYARRVAGARLELAVTADRAAVRRDGEPWMTFPSGWRVELDRAGEPAAVVGLGTAMQGELRVGAERRTLAVAPDQRIALQPKMSQRVAADAGQERTAVGG